MAKGISKSMPWDKVETKDVRKASYSGLNSKSGNAYGGLEATISKMGDGTGNASIKGREIVWLRLLTHPQKYLLKVRVYLLAPLMLNEKGANI